MKILFIDACDTYLGRRKTLHKVTPLIGMAYVATYTKNVGHDVQIYDCVIAKKMGKSLIETLKKFEPDAVALTSTTPFIEKNYQIAAIIHKILPKAFVILGGPHASTCPYKCFEECCDIDYIVVGEGEQSFSILLNNLDSKNYDAQLPGVIKRGQPLAMFKHRNLLTDLDSLPFPDWSLYNYSNYDAVYSYCLERSEKLFQLLFSRGCPYNCTFCYNIFGASYRSRSVQNVIKELESASKKFGAKFFDFVDPTMTLNRERFVELCNTLKKTGLNEEIAWNFETRADLVDIDLLNKAKGAGCESILFGLEAGSQEILNSMKKGFTVKQALKAIELASRSKLIVKATLIIGSPFETNKTLKETISFVKKAKSLYEVEFLPSFLGVYPGTEVFDLVENGKGNSKWVEGVRFNWKKARRDKPMIEMTNLRSETLVEYMNELKAII